MRDAKVPLAYRDSCANLLIPLNRCRFETYYLPWKCEVRPFPSGIQETMPRPSRQIQSLCFCSGIPASVFLRQA